MADLGDPVIVDFGIAARATDDEAISKDVEPLAT